MPRNDICFEVKLQAKSNQDGSYSITAHDAVVNVPSGKLFFEPGTGRTILVSKFGKVVRYTKVAD